MKLVHHILKDQRSIQHLENEYYRKNSNGNNIFIIFKKYSFTYLLYIKMKKDKREIDYPEIKTDIIQAIMNMNWNAELKLDVIKEVWNRK